MTPDSHEVLLGRIVSLLGRSAAGSRAWGRIRVELDITNVMVDEWVLASRAPRKPAPSLFNTPPATPNSGTDTSRAAAEVMTDAAARTARQRVLEAITSAEGRGLTDEEGTALLGMGGNTYRPRRWDLAGLGFVRKAGTRATASGRQADVWVAL